MDCAPGPGIIIPDNLAEAPLRRALWPARLSEIQKSLLGYASTLDRIQTLVRIQAQAKRALKLGFNARSAKGPCQSASPFSCDGQRIAHLVRLCQPPNSQKGASMQHALILPVLVDLLPVIRDLDPITIELSPGAAVLLVVMAIIWK